WPEEKTIHDFARRMGQIYKIDSNITLRPMEIQKIVDLTPEYNRQVTHIVHESGKSTFLRVFDDLYVKPNEQEIAAAFKRIVSELQKVAFIEGNGERSIYNTSDQHYEYFSSDKRFRSSLINQGFDVYTHNLEQPIPENISIVVIADPREMLDEVEMKHLRAFIARGGNMLITGEPRRNEIMNSIIGEFGVEALPGVVVRDSKMIQADQILARVTKSAGDIFHKVKTMHSREINVIMPGVAALKCNEDKGFKVKPLLTSDTDSTWIERQTVDFVDDTARFNPEKGDIPGTFPLALSLSRKVNEKEQRIVIMSDADCFCNGEIFRRRTGQKIANNNFLEGIFYYLSGDEVPINMYRPLPTDYTVKIRTAGLGIVKIFIMWIIPALLAVAGIVIWIRRRGR
ncbi:MAG: Gldg family protein, partial [Rikenellaceae bacterium]|nr:Gldg family protein [Rikenellaceae bacterium]